jgi:DNA-binding NarL/FixJ family response regulator
MIIDEAYLLDVWLRMAPSSALAERLAQLAAVTDSKLVAVLADHARALVAADPEGLLAASERFAGMTAWWMAAEAATEAARLFDRQHRARAATAAVRTAARCYDRCEGRRPLAVEGPGGPIRLTRREREIATLAAAGRSSKEIAERIYLSPRTVENHLHRAYIKLGVTDRAALAAALAPGEPG